MRTLVEGFDPDQVALAGLLAREGRRVTLVGAEGATPAAREVAALGVTVSERTTLGTLAAGFDEAFPDVWTPEVAPGVAALRAAGCRIRSLADLVLERAPAPTVGVTGTAGKTTTAAFAVGLLRRCGLDVRASTTARAGNLWPTTELLAPGGGTTVLELTSSHLCFTARSPSVAVVTSFWPDHLELHGSLGAYRAAKEAIVRHQAPADTVVANADDAEAVRIAEASPARQLRFSARAEVALGAHLRAGAVVLRDEDGDHAVALPGGLDLPRTQAVLAAAATAVALGVRPTRLDGLRPPHFRATVVGRAGRVELVDDAMAATPAKTEATLGGRPDRSVVLVAGGELAIAGRAVHASDEEEALLRSACREVERAAREVVLFGPAADRIEPLLRAVPVRRASSVARAIADAAAHLHGLEALVVSPMFPLAQPVRESVAPALGELVDAE
jgi:UDP-N-acetylmuramoylalanine--D-glutamate ligase